MYNKFGTFICIDKNEGQALPANGDMVRTSFT
jgi:hypothetical protein